ncbi:MAG: tetratricopeptide repeat protein, partial [Candidatus Competibacteraceae bacterium]
HRIAELTAASHEHFVGRTWELAGLGAEFIGSSAGSEVKPVAVITGLGGMGKTALVAETLALWETRFEWVLLYQAKPNAIGFDATLRDIDLKLRGELGRYHNHVKARPADAIYRDTSAEFTGPARLERLTRNLTRALLDEAILLVLDNFETNLKPQAEPSSVAGRPVWACQDTAWDHCLTALAQELIGSASRVLITSRKPLAALADCASYPVPLGPLPALEAALYLRAHPALSRMVFGPNAGEKALALRLLNASRFHPLLMDRLARLAADAKLRPQLLQALDTLEQTKDFAQLPALFATTPGDTKELAYLNDALAVSLDQLIGDASPDARRVLWMIAVANEPVTLGLLNSVWSGENSPQQVKLRQLKQMFDHLPLLPPELQEKLKAMPPEVRARLDALPPVPSPRPNIQPLLSHLVSVGLVTEERQGPDDANPDLTCHELVRERIRAWMDQQPQYRGEWTENAIRLAYAEWLKVAFKKRRHQDITAALQMGSRALVYYIQARAWDRLGDFAGSLVTSIRDPRRLETLLPYLQTAAQSAPEGQLRWRCFRYYADALQFGGYPDASLPFYKQAADWARAAAEAGGESSRQAWGDLSTITGNLASTLLMTEAFGAARQYQIETAEARNKAGRPAVYVIGSELEVLRIDIIQGKDVATTLAEVVKRLAQLEAWWEQHRIGKSVNEAPNIEALFRALIAALDIASEAHIKQEDWESALRRLDDALEIMRELKSPEVDIAGRQMNRANVLKNLGRFAEARAKLEACLPLFQNDPARSAMVLSSLAGLFYKQGDVAQAITQERRALALHEQLPNPANRAISHGNLAFYLDRHGTTTALAESPLRHQLAALIYQLVAGLGQDLQTSLRNYAALFRHARAAGVGLAVPRLAELLADPAFHPLDEWLRQRQVDVAKLQADVDQFREQARQVALNQP